MDLLSIILAIKIDKYYCICKEDKIMENAEYLRKLTNGDILFVTRTDRLESYIACIQDSITNNYENIYIFEDKTVFIFENIERHLNLRYTNIPRDFDIFFLNYNIKDGYHYDLNLFDIREINNTTNQILNKKIFKEIIDNKHLPYEEILSIISMKNKKSFGLYPQISLIETGMDISLFKNRYYKDFEVYCHQTENWSKFLEIGNVLFKNIKTFSNLPDDKICLVIQDNVILNDNFVKDINLILLDMDKFDWDVIMLSEGHDDSMALKEPSCGSNGTDSLALKEPSCGADLSKYTKLDGIFVPNNICYFIKNNNVKNIYRLNKNIVKINSIRNDCQLTLNNDEYTDKNITIKLDINNKFYSTRDYIYSSGVTLNKNTEYVICFAGNNFSLYVLNILKRLKKPVIIFTDSDVDFVLDDIFYIRQEKILSLYDKLKKTDLYVSDLSLIYELNLDRKIKYIYFYNYTPNLPFDIRVGLKNSLHMIEEIICPTTEVCLKNKQARVQEYIPEKIQVQKKKQVVCIDRYNFNKAIDFYSKLPGDYKIIFYSYKIDNNNNPNIIIKKYNIHTMINDIRESEYMIYESNEKNTFICLAEAKFNNTTII